MSGFTPLLVGCSSGVSLDPSEARLGPDRLQVYSGDFAVDGPESRVCMRIGKAYKFVMADSAEAHLFNEASGKSVAVWATFLDGNGQRIIPDAHFREKAIEANTLCFRSQGLPAGTTLRRIELKANDTLTVSHITWSSGNVE